jgi:hypothetical protein
MRKSWAYGAGTVLVVHAAWFGLVFSESRVDRFMAAIVVMLFVVMNVAGLGAFITAFTAPRRGFLLGLTLAPLAALLATVSNLLMRVTGNRVDFSGFYDNFGLFTVSLGYGLLACAVGGAVGLWMRRRNGGAATGAATEPEPARPVEPFISDPGLPTGPAPPAGHI